MTTSPDDLLTLPDLTGNIFLLRKVIWYLFIHIRCDGCYFSLKIPLRQDGTVQNGSAIEKFFQTYRDLSLGRELFCRLPIPHIQKIKHDDRNLHYSQWEFINDLILLNMVFLPSKSDFKHGHVRLSGIPTRKIPSSSP